MENPVACPTFHWRVRRRKRPAAPAKKEVAALEDGRGVSEDEVDGAVDAALSVELPEGEGVEGVLVAGDGAPVEDRVTAWPCPGPALL